jgi:ABC-type oligopeptide transport system ATPase subunit
VNGKDLIDANKSERKALRREMQMIFQDPYESLNPMMTIGEIIMESLLVHGIGKDYTQRRKRAAKALESAGLKPAERYLDSYPHELSGGQRQRVVIAGALVLEPSVLLADEPVSMLDVSIRAGILNLLSDLRREHQISMLYITHDLSTVAYIADRIAVMYLGRIVEIGPAHQVLNNPQHPYTKALRSVVPVPNQRLRGQHIILAFIAIGIKAPEKPAASRFTIMARPMTRPSHGLPCQAQATIAVTKPVIVPDRAPIKVSFNTSSFTRERGISRITNPRITTASDCAPALPP